MFTKNQNIFLFIIICRCEVISAPNITMFLLKPLPSDYEKLPRASNPMLFDARWSLIRIRTFIKISILVTLTPQNKQFLNVKSALSIYNHNNINIRHFFMFKYSLTYFNKWPSNFIPDLVLISFNNEARFSLDPAGGLILQSLNPLDTHAKTW